MDSLSRRTRRALATAVFLGAGALAVALLPVSSEAVLRCPKIIDYEFFFDAAKTQHAGYCTRVCNGQLNCSGTTTAYYTILSQEPCGCS